MLGYLKPYVCFIILRFRELGWAYTKSGAVKSVLLWLFVCQSWQTQWPQTNLPGPPKNPVFITNLDVNATSYQYAVMYPQSSYSPRETPRESSPTLTWHQTSAQSPACLKEMCSNCYQSADDLCPQVESVPRCIHPQSLSGRVLGPLGCPHHKIVLGLRPARSHWPQPNNPISFPSLLALVFYLFIYFLAFVRTPRWLIHIGRFNLKRCKSRYIILGYTHTNIDSKVRL